MTRSLHCLVSGQVQGVAYRAFVLDQARKLGLTGWVRNLPGGQVEVMAQGPDEALGKLKGQLRKGPYLARVDTVESDFFEHEATYTDFQITR